MPHPLPTQIGRFQIEAEVGRGSTGVVYRATDPILGRTVALKVLSPQWLNHPDTLSRFQREATLVSHLKHANIALVYDFGEIDEQPYIAFEWIQGETLKALLEREGALSVERGLHIFRQLVNALTYAHQQGIVHRDLKPANILIGPDDRATIVDFGLAWLENDQLLTATGAILGTPLYMSPEQIEGKAVSHQTDIYSLGILLYEMLAGTPPFAQATTSALLYQQLLAPPPSIREFVPSIPTRIEEALTTALVKEPEQRYDSVEEFRHAVDAVESLPPVTSSNRHVAWPWIAITLVVFLLLAVSIWQFVPTLTTISPSDSRASEIVGNSAVPMVWTPVAYRYTVCPERSYSVETHATRPLADEWVELNLSGAYDGEFKPLASGIHWSFPLSTTQNLALHTALGRLVFAVDSTLYNLDLQTGELLWTGHFDGPVVTLYLGKNGGMSVITSEPYGYDMWLESGELAWVCADLSAHISEPVTALLHDGQYLASAHGLYGLNNPFEHLLDLSSETTLAPFVNLSESVTLLAGENQILYGVDRRTSSIVHRWQLPQSLVARPVYQWASESGVEQGGQFVVPMVDGRIHAYAEMTGILLWETELPQAHGEILGISTDYYPGLFVVTTDGMLSRLDASTGDLLWQIELTSIPITAPYATYETLFIATQDGNLRYFDAESGQELDDWGHDLGMPILSPPRPTEGWLLLHVEGAVIALKTHNSTERD